MSIDSSHSELDKTIHEPARLKIMSLLSVIKRADCVFLMKEGGFSWGNLSSHLSKLETAGFVKISKGFVGKKPQTMVELTGGGRRAFVVYRQHLQSLLGDD